MHELGIMYKVVETVLSVADRENLSRIDALVLEIGEKSPVVPRYIRACYPAAVDGTMMENTRLEIEVLEGREFNIKEIIAF